MPLARAAKRLKRLKTTMGGLSKVGDDLGLAPSGFGVGAAPAWIGADMPTVDATRAIDNFLTFRKIAI